MRGIKSAIVPNSIIVPALPSKRVNIDGIIAANSEELGKKQPLCLTREFHVDALRAQHEYRALGGRLRGAAMKWNKATMDLAANNKGTR